MVPTVPGYSMIFNDSRFQTTASVDITSPRPCANPHNSKCKPNGVPIVLIDVSAPEKRASHSKLSLSSCAVTFIAQRLRHIRINPVVGTQVGEVVRFHPSSFI